MSRSDDRGLYDQVELEGELCDAEDIPFADVVDVAKRLDIIFDARVFSEQLVPLATGIDTREWASGVLVVTLHQRNEWPPDTTLDIAVEVIDVVPEDPEPVFVGPVAANVNIQEDDPLSSYVQLENLVSLGARARVLARWSIRADEAIEPQRISVSVQLVGRRHRKPNYEVLPT